MQHTCDRHNWIVNMPGKRRLMWLHKKPHKHALTSLCVYTCSVVQVFISFRTTASASPSPSTPAHYPHTPPHIPPQRLSALPSYIERSCNLRIRRSDEFCISPALVIMLMTLMTKCCWHLTRVTVSVLPQQSTKAWQRKAPQIACNELLARISA